MKNRPFLTARDALAGLLSSAMTLCAVGGLSQVDRHSEVTSRDSFPMLFREIEKGQREARFPPERDAGEGPPAGSELVGGED